MKKHITLPLTKETAASLTAGDSVLLSGTVYTARDAAHQRLTKMIAAGAPLPLNLTNAAIYYVGPTPAPEGKPIGSAGPTTASRCDKYTPALLEQGVTVLIGKGKRSSAVNQAIADYSAVYFAVTGGAGAMLANCIQASEIIAFPDLGTEAIRRLTVKNFPAVVINDCRGGDYYETARQAYLNSLKT